MSTNKMFFIWVVIGYVIILFVPLTIFQEGGWLYLFSRFFDAVAPNLRSILTRSSYADLAILYYMTMWALVPIQIFFMYLTERKAFEKSKIVEVKGYTQIREKPVISTFLAAVLFFLSFFILTGYLSLDADEVNQLFTSKIYYPMTENIFFMPIIAGIIFSLMSMMVARLVVIAAYILGIMK